MFVCFTFVSSVVNLIETVNSFYYNIIYLLYKTSYLNEEANCIEPSLSVSVPWLYHPTIACTREVLLKGKAQYDRPPCTN